MSLSGILALTFGLLLFVSIIIIAIAPHTHWLNTIQSIKAEFDLVENHYYDVLQHNGKTTKQLKFINITKGNNSKNGRINLLFLKTSRPQNGGVPRQVVIKYNTIAKVIKLPQAAEVVYDNL